MRLDNDQNWPIEPAEAGATSRLLAKNGNVPIFGNIVCQDPINTQPPAAWTFTHWLASCEYSLHPSHKQLDFIFWTNVRAC